MLFFVLYLVTSTTVYTVDSLQRISKDDLELERQLSLINKSPVKSIHVFSTHIFIIGSLINLIFIIIFNEILF
jgi:hypothetical protein